MHGPTLVGHGVCMWFLIVSLSIYFSSCNFVMFFWEFSSRMANCNLVTLVSPINCNIAGGHTINNNKHLIKCIVSNLILYIEVRH